MFLRMPETSQQPEMKTVSRHKNIPGGFIPSLSQLLRWMWRFVSHNSASISSDWGNQIARMVMLPVSYRQHVKLYASWTRCSGRERGPFGAPLLPAPATVSRFRHWEFTSPSPFLPWRGRRAGGTEQTAGIRFPSAASHLSELWEITKAGCGLTLEKGLFGLNQFVRIYWG